MKEEPIPSTKGLRLCLADGGLTATVWLDRPERLNALDAAMWEGLDRLFGWLRGQADVRVVLVRSACERAFCTGLDLLAGGGVGADGLGATIRRYQRIFDAIEDHPRPVAAVLHGFVLGGGLELALACDLRLCADDALLGLTEAKVGLIPACGGTQRLARYVGLGRAKFMALTGEKIDAAQALSWGLCDLVAPRAELDAAVAALGDKLLAAAPLSQLHAKSLVQRSFELDRDAGGQAEADAVMALAHSADLIEGMTAFAHERAPRWRGR